MNQVINIPEGFELKKVSETEYQIIPKERKLPKTWNEFCNMKDVTNKECFINSCSLIKSVDINIVKRSYDVDKNLCPSKEVAEGILALMQLIQLRDYYNDGWKPGDDEWAYTLYCDHGMWRTHFGGLNCNCLFYFQNEEIATKFGCSFKDLLDKVKYLF